ncbi:putative endonuclease-reverse transcriptase [Trichonephila clavipes]|nr:putative endonuclease-reverse transcriptase [Trichonephila clavipes]
MIVSWLQRGRMRHLVKNADDKTEVLRRWNEHFYNLLNSDNGDYEALTGSSETQSRCVVEPLSLEEVIEPINKLKNNKVPDPDAISSEILKNGGKETSKKVYDLIQAIWEQWKIQLETTKMDSGEKGRSSTVQIFNIRQVLEKTREFGIDTHHIYIDFKTAYDRINRKVLIAAMKEFDRPGIK